MSNHPNRSRRTTSAANPKPVSIKAAREAYGTQSECAALIHASLRAWQQWEAGDRRMHRGLWELFLNKSTKEKRK